MIGYLNVPYNSKVLQCLSGNCPSGSGIFKITLVQSCLSVPERFFLFSNKITLYKDIQIHS